MEKLTFPNLGGNFAGVDLFLETEKNRIKSYNDMAAEDTTGIQCEICKNKGTIAYLSEDTKRMCTKDCKCKGTRLTIARLQQQGLWDRAKENTLDRYETVQDFQKALKQKVESYLSDPTPNWLMLCGQSGAGKTHLCIAAFVKLSFERGMNGRYMVWTSDGRRAKNAIVDGEEKQLDEYKTCQLLYIDDLFKTKAGIEPSDADVRLVFDLLDYRVNNKLVTIISSELCFEQLQQLDQAIAGRIKQMCGGGKYLASIGKDITKNYRLKG